MTQHIQILTIGDYTKHETRRYFREQILKNLPEHLQTKLDFERLYEAFGGKIAHWQDFATDFGEPYGKLKMDLVAKKIILVNANGRLDSKHRCLSLMCRPCLQCPSVKQSSHFLQAHSLLNLHVIHSAQAPPHGVEDTESPRNPDHQANGHAVPGDAGLQRTPSRQPLSTGTGFRIYSPLTFNVDPHSSPASFEPAGTGSSDAAEFTAIQLLKVMDRLVQPGTRALSYFLLCREMGARAVDGMVRGRILDLRWTDPVSKEYYDPRVLSMRRESLHANRATGAGSSGTMVNEVTQDENPHARFQQLDEDGEMTALTDEEFLREEQRVFELRAAEEEDEIVGPKLVPTTPIMRFAMREVVQEYYEEDDRTVSEYASLSGSVQEY